MSIEAVSWALNEAPVEKDGPASVLLGLANHADPDGTNSWPSVERLAYYARMSPRSVRRHLATLINDHVIEVDEDTRARDAKTRPDQRPVVYRLRMDRKRESYEERQDRIRREAEKALTEVPEEEPNGVSDCPGGQIDRADNLTERGDNLTTTGCQPVTQPTPEPSAEPHSPTGSDAGARAHTREGAPPREDDPQLALVPDPEPDPKPKRRATRIGDWTPDEALRAWAREYFPAIDLDHEVAQFRDFHTHRGKPGLDWAGAWRTWVRNARKFAERTGGRRRQNYRNDESGRGAQGWDDFMQGGRS